MQFNVSQLLKASPGEERRYSFDEQERRYAELAADVHGDVRLMRTDRGVLVMGEVRVGGAVAAERRPRPAGESDHHLRVRSIAEQIDRVAFP